MSTLIEQWKATKQLIQECADSNEDYGDLNASRQINAQAFQIGVCIKELDEARCKNCKWWNVGFENTEGQRPCNHPSADSGRHDGFNNHDDDVMVVRFGPDFGCVHFEQKP